MGQAINWQSLFCLTVLLFPLATQADSNKKTHTIGIVPQFETQRLQAIWQPILNEEDYAPLFDMGLDRYYVKPTK